jgi:hypothetical protein
MSIEPTITFFWIHMSICNYLAKRVSLVQKSTMNPLLKNLSLLCNMILNKTYRNMYNKKIDNVNVKYYFMF